ncbi:DUF4352 domain-containing protein [Streptomyces otsuchiensis]|uniref:DUF4352 domain-containing protein n=1 Tax=Streptomyces otsuchiensis TaxID=2681388 RepID=UPI0013009B16|nr:DUF4352 domain-containing protein [Streptomyces otsuchiensis]
MGNTKITARVRPIARGFARRRMLAVAGVTGAALVMGGMTACTPDDGDKPKRDDSSAATEDTADGEADQADAGDDEAEGDDGQSGVFAIGDTAVYDNLGVKVTISDPEVIEPESEWDEWGAEGFTAMAFTVVIENEGEESYNGDLTVFNARAGEDGVEAESVYAWDIIGDGSFGTVLPGNKATAKIAFDAPEDAGSLTIELSDLNDWESESAFWTHEF